MRWRTAVPGSSWRSPLPARSALRMVFCKAPGPLEWLRPSGRSSPCAVGISQGDDAAPDRLLLKLIIQLLSFTSRSTQQSSAHAPLASSPPSPAASLPGHPDRRPSRKQQSVHQSRRESTFRRLPSRLLLVREDQTYGTSSAEPRKDRTIPSPDRAPDTAPRWQIPRSALPPPDLRRARPFSDCRETPPTTAPPKPAPAREFGPPFAGPPFRGQPVPAATAPHPVG